jgi:hypothetical protein
MTTGVDVGLAELTRRMQASQPGASPAEVAPGAEASAEVSLSLKIGRLVGLMEQDRKRRQLMNQLVNIIDIPPIDFVVTAGQPAYKAYRASGADGSPQEGLIWFVQRVTVAGLNAGDILNLNRTVSVPATAKSSALHAFPAAPAGIAAGTGIVDWEPGGTGLALRPDDQLFLVSGGVLTAVELVMTGQAVQVDLRILAEYLI